MVEWMVITNMKQFHFHLKNAGFQNSYFYVGSDRSLALQSCVEEFKKDCKNLGILAISFMIDYETVHEI